MSSVWSASTPSRSSFSTRCTQTVTRSRTACSSESDPAVAVIAPPDVVGFREVDDDDPPDSAEASGRGGSWRRSGNSERGLFPARGPRHHQGGAESEQTGDRREGEGGG